MAKNILKNAGRFFSGKWTRRRVLVTGAWTGLGMFLLGSAYLLVLSITLPSVDQIDTRQIPQSTRIFDRTGKVLLYEVSGDQRRVLVSWQDIPKSTKDAVLAIEDEDFYSEPAFSWKGILRAAVANLTHGGIVQGASTITQQLARNAFLSPEQTINRKVREILLAIRLSRHYTKDQIFELYLNEVPFGPTFYGVNSASEAYFGKPATKLTIAESALLAAVLKAPSYYSPWGNHTKELFTRQRLVLQKMRDQDKITDSEYKTAVAQKLEFQPPGTGIKAPHFVMAVQDYLIKKYGEDMVRTGGLNVVTTLDWDMQQAGERVVAEGAERNESLYGGKNSALVAEDPKTGQILALVGSRDYFDTENEGNFNVATQGLRQPGSTLKPFVYMTAFEAGYTPDTVLFDVPTEFRVSNNCPNPPDLNVPNTFCFHPQNFDGDFRGPVQMKVALAQSVNVPAVKTLYLAGLRSVLSDLKNFGVTTLDSPDRYGLSLVLGGGEVKLIELTGAYSMLATEGIRHDQALVMEIEDGSGNVLESYADKADSVIDPEYPRLINNILSDASLRAGLFSSSLSLTVFPGYDVALKTGTTNDYRDAWAMGYTPGLAVGVWAGNNDNTPMQRRGSSILAAVPIWHDFMVEALKKVPTESFTSPDPLPAEKLVLAGSLPDGQPHNILYYVSRSSPAGAAPAAPAADPQFDNWETAVAVWAQNHPGALDAYRATQTVRVAPTDGVRVSLVSPASGSYLADSLRVQAQIQSSADISRVRVLWNGAEVESLSGPLPAPYFLDWEFRPADPLLQNSLEVRAESAGQSGQAQVIVYK